MPDLFSQAVRLCWAQRRVLFDVAFVPIVISFLLDIAARPLIVGSDTMNELQLSPTGPVFGIAIYLALLALPWTAFAVGWIRFCLIGPPETGGPAGLRWSSRETRYLLGLLGMFIIYFAIFVVMGLVLAVLGVGRTLSLSVVLTVGMLALIVAGYVLARISLILPAAATETRLGMIDSWRYTDGNGWRLFALFGLLFMMGEFASVLVASVLYWIAGSIFDTPLSVGPSIVVQLGLAFASFFAMAPLIAASALAYRFLTGWRPNGTLRVLTPPATST